MIDWLAFVVVAAVSIAGSAAVVGVFALGLRLLAVEQGRMVVRVSAYACFVVVALGVLYGVSLLIPGLHGV